MQEINNNTVIKNISTDQSEILKNIMQLHNNNEPFECDITASELKFYKKNKKTKYDIPIPKILMDVYPQSDSIIKITPFQKLPLEDNSISSIVFDPPFVISPKDCKSKTITKEGSNLISNRFSSFYPVDELYYNYYWWIKECYRTTKDDGILVLKCMSTVSGGYQHNSEEWTFLCAINNGFYCVDKFYLEATNRIVANSHFKNGQQHARKYTSVFFVFKKNAKMAKKFNYIKMLNDLNNENLENFDITNLTKKKKKTNVEYVDNILNKTKTKNKKNTIIQLNLEGELIQEWDNYDCIIEKYPKISKSSLSQCVNGKTQTAGGFKWNKKENVEEIPC